MRPKDLELAEKIAKEIDRLLEATIKSKPSYKPKDLPAELHGYLADMLFIDKVENQFLVSFLISLAYTRSGHGDAEIIRLFENMSSALKRAGKTTDNPS